MSRVIIAVAVGQVIGALAWIGPLFIPLVLVGPLVSGAWSGVRGIPLLLVAIAWGSAGLNMLVADWLINREDVVFHAAVTVTVVALAAAAWRAGRFVVRRRDTAVESNEADDADESLV